VTRRVNDLPGRRRAADARGRHLRAALAVLALLAAISAFAKKPLLVADPAAPLAEAWTHQSLGTATEYKGIVYERLIRQDTRRAGANHARGGPVLMR
jgi:hypothetical protein